MAYTQQSYGSSAVIAVPVQTTHVTQVTAPNVALDEKQVTKNALAHSFNGFMLIVFGITAASIDCYYGFTWMPIWMGLYMIFCAGWAKRAAYASGYYRFVCIRRYRVMNTFAFMEACCLIGTFGASAAKEIDMYYYPHSYNARIGIDATIIALSVFEFFTSLKGLQISSSFMKTFETEQRLQGVSATTTVTVTAQQPVPGFQQPVTYQYGTEYAQPGEYPPQQGFGQPPQAYPQGYGQPPQAYPQGYSQPPPGYNGTEQPPPYGLKQ